MLIQKHKLFLVFSIVLTLLLVDISSAERGGSRGHGSGRSAGSGFSSRQSYQGISRSRSSVSQQRFVYNRNSYNRSSYSYSQSRRPYATTISPNAWRFNGQEALAYRNNNNVITYRPPAVLTNPRVSGKEIPAYRNYVHYNRYDNKRYDKGRYYNDRDRYSYNRYYGYDRNGYNRNYNYRYDNRRYDYRRSHYYYRRGYSPYYYGYGFGWSSYNSWYWPYFYGGYYWPNNYSSYYNGYNNYYSDSQPTYRYTHYPRRYIFVSLNGFWPGYNYYRYYNYGTYPYFWYITANSSYQPLESYPPTNSSYNDDKSYTYEGGDAEHESFANVSQPAKPTSADKYFQKGVDFFAAGNYAKASDYFHQAKSHAPKDVILPFAYIQSLFAEGKYVQAARQLRDTIERQSGTSECAFYPRGLYLDDQVLMKQIDTLLSQASSNSDLQLLAGYQLLGIHKFDAALDYLNKSQASDKNNQIVVGRLLYVLNELKASYQTTNAESENLSK